MPHMLAIKDFLLLGRCDFFSIFLEASADTMLGVPHATNATPNLERAMQSAAARTGVDSLPEFECVSVAWQRTVAPLAAGDGAAQALVPAFFLSPTDYSGAAAPSWNTVVFSYAPPWPLPLLLTRDAMEVRDPAAMIC